MDEKFPTRRVKLVDDEDFENYSKEELICKIKSLTAHNYQLKSILAKSSAQKQTKELKPFDFSKHQFRHIFLKLLYLGWDYKGYVVQEDTTNTIENYLFEALIKTKLIKDRPSSNYHRCGRTDKGVSAFGQVISIDVRSNVKEGEADDAEEINYCKNLNRVLPDNIRCVGWTPAKPDFSARFNCNSRTYKYYFPKGNLNIEKMKAASDKLVGTHDFRNLCKMDVGNGVVEFVRNIHGIDIQPVADSTGEYSVYVIAIKAKAFLWHQIRCIMGILILVGQNKEEPSLIKELLDVEKNPRKPEYTMASEIPLNLFSSAYDDISWRYDKETLQNVIKKLNTMWTFQAVKETMLKDMIDVLKSEYQNIETNGELFETCLSEDLLPNLKSKRYIQVMKRNTCDSLEDKIKRFSKRKRIAIGTNK